MKKSILIGISIVTVLGILIAAVALGFGNPGTKSNSFANTEVNEPVKKEEVQMTLADTGISDSDPKIDIKGAIQYAQSNVSFRIIEPSYIPSGYKFEV